MAEVKGLQDKADSVYTKLKKTFRPEPDHISKTWRNFTKLYLLSLISFGGTIAFVKILEYQYGTLIAYSLSFAYFIISFEAFRREARRINDPDECDYCTQEVGRENLERTIMEINEGFREMYQCDSCLKTNKDHDRVYSRDEISFNLLKMKFEAKETV